MEFDETVEDLRDAFEQLRAAGASEPGHRRALKAVLNELYRVQAYRLGREDAHSTAYYSHAEACDAGKITLGIVFLRGVLTHHLVKQVKPTLKPLYPSPNLYPSEDLYTTNFVWISGDDLKKVYAPKRHSPNLGYYETHVGGRMVLPTIRQAINFLLTDPVVRLKYV
jgi:hypothetical protein